MEDGRELYYKKIHFFKRYSLHLLRNGVDVYSKYNLVNLRSLMIELQSELAHHEYKHLSGLVHFLIEITNYIQSNHFFNKKVTIEISQLSSSLAILKSSDTEQAYVTAKAYVIGVVDLFLSKITGTEILFEMVSEIERVIYSSEKLIESNIKIQSLASDYISEILLRGFDHEKIKEEISKSTLRYENKTVIDKFEDAFREFIWLPLDKDNKSYTFIFKVKGLKVYIRSLNIDGVLLYNPIREDLLQWREKETIYSDEIFLLNSEEEDLLKKIRSKEEKSDEDHYDIEYTDSHARVKVSASNTKYGFIEAKNKLDNILQILKFKYSLSNLKISELYLVCDHSDGTQRIDSITPKGRIRESKFTEVAYYPRGLTKEILGDLARSNSQLNNILSVNNSKFQGNFSKVVFWYNKGQDESDNHVKFINYWVALEYLV